MCQAMELKEQRDINRGKREGREEIMLQAYRNCINRGMSKEDAIAISGITERLLKKNGLS